MSHLVGTQPEGTVEARVQGVRLGEVRSGKPGGGKAPGGPSKSPFRILVTWSTTKTSHCLLGMPIAVSGKHEDAYHLTLVSIS